MELDISTISSDAAGFDSLARISVRTKKLRLDSVRLNFSRCEFFEANMAAPLYAVVALLRDELNDVSVFGMSELVSKALRKNKFLNVFNEPSLKDSHQTTLPFKIFKLRADDQFNDYLDTYMVGKGIPTMSDALTKHFRQSLFEIFFNATVHSESGYGIFVCGQFFPHKNRLDFTIADAGVGIRENVRRHTGEELSSCDAIEWAMIEGNTTRNGRLPGGLGLRLIKDFIEMNKGKIQIVSSSGYYEFSAKGKSTKQMKNDFPGTCINIEINTEDTNSYVLSSELKSEDIF